MSNTESPRYTEQEWIERVKDGLLIYNLNRGRPEEFTESDVTTIGWVMIALGTKSAIESPKP